MSLGSSSVETTQSELVYEDEELNELECAEFQSSFFRTPLSNRHARMVAGIKKYAAPERLKEKLELINSMRFSEDILVNFEGDDISEIPCFRIVPYQQKPTMPNDINGNQHVMLESTTLHFIIERPVAFAIYCVVKINLSGSTSEVLEDIQSVQTLLELHLKQVEMKKKYPQPISEKERKEKIAYLEYYMNREYLEDTPALEYFRLPDPETSLRTHREVLQSIRVLIQKLICRPQTLEGIAYFRLRGDNGTNRTIYTTQPSFGTKKFENERGVDYKIRPFGGIHGVPYHKNKPEKERREEVKMHQAIERFTDDVVVRFLSRCSYADVKKDQFAF